LHKGTTRRCKHITATCRNCSLSTPRLRSTQLSASMCGRVVLVTMVQVCDTVTHAKRNGKVCTSEKRKHGRWVRCVGSRWQALTSRDSRLSANAAFLIVIRAVTCRKKQHLTFEGYRSNETRMETIEETVDRPPMDRPRLLVEPMTYRLPRNGPAFPYIAARSCQLTTVLYLHRPQQKPKIFSLLLHPLVTSTTLHTLARRQLTSHLPNKHPTHQTNTQPQRWAR
jgi:hypothetical protein